MVIYIYIYIIINIVGSRKCRINVHTNNSSSRRSKVVRRGLKYIMCTLYVQGVITFFKFEKSSRILLLVLVAI